MREISFAFGPDQSLVGTLTLPAGDAVPDGLGLVMFNSGVVHRIGPHRVNVKLARQMARHGMPSIRFDLHGMGDSLRAGGALTYDQQVVIDLGMAMDALHKASGAARFAMLGFCSGAMPSYLTAQADPRVDTIILYDALIFPTPKSRARFLWLRLSGYGFGPKAMLYAVARLARGLANLPRRALERLQPDRTKTVKQVGAPSEKHQILHGLAKLAQRGVKIIIMHAGDDFGAVNYAGQFRDATGDALPSEDVRCDFLENIDHVATSTPAQRVFLDAVCSTLLGGNSSCSHPVASATSADPTIAPLRQPPPSAMEPS